MTYYTGNGEDVQEVTTYVARSGDTLARYVASDEEGLYIKAVRRELEILRMLLQRKARKIIETGTYGNYRELLLYMTMIIKILRKVTSSCFSEITVKCS